MLDARVDLRTTAYKADKLPTKLPNPVNQNLGIDSFNSLERLSKFNNR